MSCRVVTEDNHTLDSIALQADVCNSFVLRASSFDYMLSCGTQTAGPLLWGGGYVTTSFGLQVRTTLYHLSSYFSCAKVQLVGLKYLKSKRGEEVVLVLQRETKFTPTCFTSTSSLLFEYRCSLTHRYLLASKSSSSRSQQGCQGQTKNQLIREGEN